MAKKFTELTTASQINETDITAISQENNGVWGSFKATISAIAQKIITGINFANAFNTNAKTVAGAINEKLTSNAVADIEVSPAESAHSEGDYLIYNGLLYLVIDDIAIGDALTTGAGGNIEAAQIADGIGGGGGHAILNDAGSTLPQENKMQFKGVYVEDVQADEVTKVNIVRTMTKAQMEALSGEELKGFINTSDEPDSLPLTAEWVNYDDNTSVKEKIDDIEVKKKEFTLSSSPTTSVSYPTGKDKSSIQILGFAFYRNYSWYFDNKAVACVCSNSEIIVEVDNNYSYIQGLPAKILYV